MNHDVLLKDGMYVCKRCARGWRTVPSSPCPGVIWYNWREAPPYLHTYSQLRSKHMKPLNRSKPDGCIICKKEYCWLYDERQAKPRRIVTDRQRLALEIARQRQREKWKCEHCGYTPATPAEIRRYFAWPRLCKDCKAHIEEETRLEGDRLEAVEWARQIIARQDWAILDTETTSLTGYPVEIAVIAHDGSTLFHSLICPPCPVEPGARMAHGISDEELAQAPTLPQIWSDLQKALASRSLLLAYNVEFDSTVMDRAASYYQLPALAQKWDCLMLWYAQYVGDWSEYWGNYKWQPLMGGHRALGDTLAALAVLQEMARADPDTNE